MTDMTTTDTDGPEPHDTDEDVARDVDEVDEGFGAAWCGGGFVCAGPAPAFTDPKRLPVTITPYVCPWCVEGSWPDGSRCLHCTGTGTATTDDPGVDDNGDERAARPLPRPPGVMRRPCTDCAYRPGSYERRSCTRLPDETAVFFCHHGLNRTGGPGNIGYVAPVMVAGMPVGAMVCGGWWGRYVDGDTAELEPFHDPGGSDRSADAPEEIP